MRKDKEKDQALVTEVKQKLDWYINDASDKEYDEKAVASLEYLLETLEPADDFKVDEEKAWVKFKDYVEQREAHGGAKGDKPPKIKSHPAFLSHPKGLVAAAILVLLLAVSIGTSSEAVRNTGFFHWIKEKVGGREMITVPDSLDEMTEQEQTVIYTDRESIPDEWKEWSAIEQSVMGLKGVEWKFIEIIERPEKMVVQSRYEYNSHSVIIGVLGYSDGGAQEVEIFDRFEKYDTWEIDGSPFGVGSIQEEKRITYYIEFFDNNFKYYIIGSEHILNEMKELVSAYRIKIKK